MHNTDDLSSILRAHSEGKNLLLKLNRWPSRHAMCAHTHMHTHTVKLNLKEYFIPRKLFSFFSLTLMNNISALNFLPNVAVCIHPFEWGAHRSMKNNLATSNDQKYECRRFHKQASMKKPTDTTAHAWNSVTATQLIIPILVWPVTTFSDNE